MPKPGPPHRPPRRSTSNYLSQRFIDPVLPTGPGVLKVIKNVPVNSQRDNLLGIASKRSRWKRSRRPLLAPSVISLQPTSEAIGGSSGFIAGAVDSDGLERRSRSIILAAANGPFRARPVGKGNSLEALQWLRRPGDQAKLIAGEAIETRLQTESPRYGQTMGSAALNLDAHASPLPRPS